jgi:hypothetical protein
LFDPSVVRHNQNLGLIKIKQSSMYPRHDVYILVQHATQVYYLSYPCKTNKRLKVGMLCTRYRHTVNYLPQTMKITTY